MVVGQVAEPIAPAAVPVGVAHNIDPEPVLNLHPSMVDFPVLDRRSKIQHAIKSHVKVLRLHFSFPHINIFKQT